jgi:SynChlorMet cassette radical SAM/SPASM protein ScmF
MSECKNTFVSVSLDGAEAETHEWVRGVVGCFEDALVGIRNLVDAGLKPQIIMSIMRQNKNHVESIVRLAEHLGAGSVKFNIVQPATRGERMHFSGETLDIAELVDLGKWVENILSAATDLGLYYDHPLAFRPLGKMFGENGDGCGTCGILSILGVLANGSYALCGIGETVVGLVFGKADKDPLEHVWINTPVLQEIRQGLPHRLEGICGQCLMNKICLASCLAQNYYRSTNLWEPFWYCKEAYSRKLFPASRLPAETGGGK